MDSALERFLREQGLEADGLRPLAGDASSRRYYRAPVASSSSTVVIMADAPFPAAEPGRETFAFARWRAFLADLDIRVPQILAMDRAAGLAVLEDLGDELLQHRVEREGAEACEAQYEQAVAWGRRLAERGSPRFDPAKEPFDDPLNATRLGVEMDFFLQHALGLSAPPDESAEGELAEARGHLHALCTEVHAAGASEAGMVLCHRDYHARNLLVMEAATTAEPGLAMIDFQDTRRGPRAYDLASLVHDPYVDLPLDMKERLIEAWRPETVSPSSWAREVQLAAGQRLIKAAGSYAYLGRSQGREEYLQWFEPALRRAFCQLACWEPATDLQRSLRAAGITW